MTKLIRCVLKWLNACRHGYNAAFEDYRFPALTKDELVNCRFSISILSSMEPITNEGEQVLINQLLAGVDGLLMTEGKLSALFLPAVWEKLPTATLFVHALKAKGGWAEHYWSNKIKLFRFHTYRYQ